MPGVGLLARVGPSLLPPAWGDLAGPVHGWQGMKACPRWAILMDAAPQFLSFPLGTTEEQRINMDSKGECPGQRTEMCIFVQAGLLALGFGSGGVSRFIS